MSPCGTVRFPSSDDVGNVRIDDPLDLVLETQFLFLETSNFYLIRGGFRQERPDSLVEPAMLGLQRLKARDRVIVHREMFYASREPPKTAELVDDPLAWLAEQ